MYGKKLSNGTNKDRGIIAKYCLKDCKNTIDVLEKIDCTVLLDKLLHYKHGAYYNVTGSKGIVNELKHTIEYHGGTILTKANVSSVKKEGVIVVNEHEINAKYIVSSLAYHKTQELIPHIEQIAEVKTLYKKIYGLLSVENYKHVDKMIVQDDSIIRCSSNKMNKNEEEKNCPWAILEH